MQGGTIIAGKYRVVRQMNQGGMGVVHHVENVGDGTRHALKLIAPAILYDVRQTVWTERFLQEARIVQALKSPHIVEVLDAGVDPEHGPFMLMELLEGEDLQQSLDNDGRPMRMDARRILEGIASALECAHAAGVVHRDLKPGNVFLVEPGRTVKLLDFGIAKLLDSGENGMNSVPIGTCAWMAPEQLVPNAHIDSRTDLWAFGLLAFQVLTGKPFWRATITHHPDIIREVCHAPLPAASARAKELGVVDGLPAQFDGWFYHCVNRNMEERFASVAAAIRALLPMLRVSLVHPTPTPPPPVPVPAPPLPDPVDAALVAALMDLRARIPRALEAMQQVVQPVMQSAAPHVEPSVVIDPRVHRNGVAVHPTPMGPVTPDVPPRKKKKKTPVNKGPDVPVSVQTTMKRSSAPVLLIAVGVAAGGMLLFALALALVSLAHMPPEQFDDIHGVHVGARFIAPQETPTRERDSSRPDNEG